MLPHKRTVGAAALALLDAGLYFGAMTAGRFYRQYRCDPYYNMAVDEWLFDRARTTPGALFVRLYSWAEGAITFGVNQDRNRALDMSQLNGTPVIRRITGGRALFHDCSELTYSVAVNLEGRKDHRWATGRSAFYGVIAEALTEFAIAMGKDADYCRQTSVRGRGAGFFHQAACFASPSRYEVVAGGAKVVASAACQQGDAMLQHGSIKLEGAAGHPALHFPMACGEADPVELQPLSRARWAQAWACFADIVSRRLDLPLEFSEFDRSEAEVLKQRTKSLHKDGLQRRIFLHT